MGRLRAGDSVWRQRSQGACAEKSQRRTKHSARRGQYQALGEQLADPADPSRSEGSPQRDLARAADIVVRTDRLDGQPRVVAIEDSAGAAAFLLEDGRLMRAKPAFAATLQARGAGDSLAKLLA